nr:RNA-directed DNA polymerase, eukaryota, reverse transcriptase zinc-binding domain protein [Tanacetum cinerariifolium]
DAIFMGQWSKRNIDTLMCMLKCFERASGLSINLSKSKLMGLAVSIENVEEVTRHIGCGILNTPFSFLGSKVGGCMSRIKSWDEVIDKMVKRLSKWKMKTLSIGGRLTLLKAVFGSLPIYHMSIFKVPMVIHAIHGVDGRIGRAGNVGYTSIWCDIIKEMDRLASHGIDLISMMHKKIENGLNTSFLEDRWRGEQRLKEVFPRIYTLEVNKHISVAFKFEQTSLSSSLRRMLRSGIESEQWDQLLDSLEGVMLNPSEDRWSWDLNGSGEFLVASTRRYIDNNRLPDIFSKTRWIKEVPIKVNVHAWKVRLNGLPTRWNISRKRIDILLFYVLYARRVLNLRNICSLIVVLLELFFGGFAFGGMNYYRCTHKFDQGCRATKQVQKTEDEPPKMPRSGIESEQWGHLLDSLEGVMLNPSEDRWL